MVFDIRDASVPMDPVKSSLSLLLVAVAVVTAQAYTPASLPLVGAMPWMCLERCGFNESTIVAQVQELSTTVGVSAVSYEWADLGPNGTFIFDNFTRVSSLIHPFAVSVAMITTVNLQYIRELFNATVGVAFAEAIAAAATAESNIDGVNFDFEPNDDSPNNDDAIGYASFLRIARRVLWEQGNGMFVSVDVAEWSTIWDWSVINEALTSPMYTTEGVAIPIGYVMTMSTYGTDDALFLNRLDAAQQNISANALVVGLEVWHSNPAVMNATQVAWRFGVLAARGLCRIAIWQAPLPSVWQQELQNLVTLCAEASSLSS